MYENQLLQAIAKNDTERIAAIKHLNDGTYSRQSYYYGTNKTKDRLTALFGSSYNSRCTS